MGNNKIGRNDICPCGSGKKYKKCCYLKVESLNSSDKHLMDTEWQRIRKTEGDIIDRFLIPYVFQTYEQDVIEEAWDDFIDHDIQDNIPEDTSKLVYENMFIPWLLFNWVPVDENFGQEHQISKPLASMFLSPDVKSTII